MSSDHLVDEFSNVHIHHSSHIFNTGIDSTRFSGYYAYCMGHTLQFVNVFYFKWPPVAILDVQKSLLAISDQYHNFYFCEFVFEMFDIMAAVGHFGCPKFTFYRISSHFR